MEVRSSAAQKLRYRQSLLAFHLDLQQFQPSARPRSHEQAASIDHQLTWRDVSISSRQHAMQSELFSAEESVGPGPGLKATPAVVNLTRRPGEVDQSVFALQDRRQGSRGIILRNRMDRARLQALQSLQHEARSALREHPEELLRCLVRFNGHGTLEQNVTGIQTLV